MKKGTFRDGVLDDDDSFRKFNMKLFKTKNEVELESFHEKKKNGFHDELNEDMLVSMDNDSLKEIIKEKSKAIKSYEEKFKISENLNIKDKEKIEELEIIVKIQQKELIKNEKEIVELKQNMSLMKENSNNKVSDYSQAQMNKTANYFTQKNQTKCDSPPNDIKILENQFSGDFDISFTSEINNNNCSKKWFFGEENLGILFDNFEIKFKKNHETNKNEYNFIHKKQFKLIDVEIINIFTSPLALNNFQLDSTESNKEKLIIL